MHSTSTIVSSVPDPSFVYSPPPDETPKPQETESETIALVNENEMLKDAVQANTASTSSTSASVSEVPKETVEVAKAGDDDDDDEGWKSEGSIFGSIGSIVERESKMSESDGIHLDIVPSLKPKTITMADWVMGDEVRLDPSTLLPLRDSISFLYYV